MSDVERTVIVGRIRPGSEERVAAIFGESDATELPKLVGVRHRSLFVLGDAYVHLIETERAFEPSLERVREHELFRDISARLEPYIAPYDPETWRSPKDAVGRCFYRFDAEPPPDAGPAVRSESDVEPDTRRGGEVRALLAPRSVGSTSGFMGTARIKPGERISEHYHPYSEEFLYVAAGTLDVQLDGASHSVHAGDAVFVPKLVRHRLVSACDEEAVVVFQLAPLAPRPELGHVDTE